VGGASRDHVIAFSRSKGREEIVVAAGRHFALHSVGGGGWLRDWTGNLATPPGAAYQNLLAPGPRMESLDLAQLFSTLPVAVLQRI
jgi:maltooligosyltrehalose synthase